MKTATITKKQSLSVAGSGSRRTDIKAAVSNNEQRTSTSMRKIPQRKPERVLSARKQKRKIEQQSQESPILLPKYPRPARASQNRKRSSRRPSLSPSRNAKEDRGSSKEKKRLTLPPFGHVLEQALTPNKSKENNE